ncbi:MAG: ANTAR domain-containing protein [Desulfarculaceae bacterium]|nr:ANTAR domain-containing protein [Desulfarculaceae bacterium]MCF8049022.1 ANTAR domain-containing protein [Desulfarculaceae bacterium]MCF8066303.1 ANTAR domain-containing protein [Desulfarculaceae bacterium]MCF8097854.1 ANTAR domain-containing protein [Desulfarculaceae bacterium]MCF8122804.1 ANTAR domain-containing protein [Desulfarculaceae bacterium]
MGQPKDKQRFKVLLASSREQDTAGLGRCLAALGHQLAGLAGEGRSACLLHHELRPDLAILDEGLAGLGAVEAARRMNARGPLPVVIISNNGRTRPSPGAEPAFVSAYISPPWEPSLIGPALAMAWQNHHRLRRLEGHVAELNQALDSRKNIERAKGVLMEQRGLSLVQAEQALEQEARRRRVSLAQVAQDVVAAQEVMSK